MRDDPMKPTDAKPEHSAISRRSFIAGTVAATIATTAASPGKRLSIGGRPQRYPDPEHRDRRSALWQIQNRQHTIQRLFTGCLWAEGPAWSNVGRFLVGATYQMICSVAGWTMMVTSALSERPPIIQTATP